MNCERCGHAHSVEEWDQLWWDWKVLLARRGNLDERRAHRAADEEMLKHGPRPAETKPPLWMRETALTIGGQNMMEALKGAWSWLSGKKTLIGSVLIGVPLIWTQVATILEAGGMAGAQIEYIAGIVVLVVGWGHKLVKMLGASEEE